jgi:signal transduction histidine kinase
VSSVAPITQASESDHRVGSARGLAAAQLKAQDHERRQFARTLHDSTAQRLATLIIGLGVLEDELATLDVAKVKDLLADCLASAEACAADIRELSQQLYPLLLDELGLGAALDVHVQSLSRHHEFSVTLNTDPCLDRLPRDSALALFRVVQEGLANARRHSGSNASIVHIENQNGQLLVEVRDSGRGIPNHVLTAFHQARPTPGMGLHMMRHRVESILGTLDIVSSSCGTTIRALVPLPANLS